MLKAELKKGASVAELARKHGISTAYIYMLP
jgi:transposase-like protein